MFATDVTVARIESNALDLKAPNHLEKDENTIIDSRNEIDQDVERCDPTEAYEGQKKYCFQRISKASSIAIGLCVFIAVSIVTAVLVIYCTSPTNSKKKCQFDLKPILYSKVENHSATRSVLVGYFNDDPFVDAVVANYGSNNIGIVLGNGDGTFSEQITYSTGPSSHPYFVTLYDVNDDRQLDIIVANYGSNSLNIFIARNGTSFADPITISLHNSRPLAVAIGDFDSDAQLDMAVVSHGTQSIAILLRFNNQSIQYPKLYSTGYDSDPRALIVADFNNDKKQDIAVANFGTSNVGIFLGNGDGTFADSEIYSTGSRSNPHFLATADLDGDRILDIAFANTGTHNVGILNGVGNGTFIQGIVLRMDVSSSPHTLVVADFNKDNFLDIAVANSGADRVALFLGYRNGTFSNAKTYLVGKKSGPQSITTGDFNNDRKIDIILANNVSNSISVLLNGRLIDFVYGNTYSTGISANPNDVVLVDLTNDGCLDIVVANTDASNVGVFLNLGDGTFSRQTKLDTGSGSGPSSVVVADVNNDRKMDIVVSNKLAYNVGVLLGYGNGTFANQMTFSTGLGSAPISAAASDFNNDHNVDIVVANLGTDSIGILLGLGNGSFATQITYSTGSDSQPTSVAVGDLNNDGRVDIAVANSMSQTIRIFFGYGNASFSFETDLSVGELSFPTGVTIADLNGDHVLDIVTVRSMRDRALYFIGVGNGSFAEIKAFWTGTASIPIRCAVSDLNGDNLPEIIVVRKNPHSMLIAEGSRNGQYSNIIEFPVDSTHDHNVVAVGDLNNDGYVDIVAASSGESIVLIYYGYYAISFTGADEFSTMDASIPSSITVSDFNHDGLDDMAVTDYNRNLVNIILTASNRSLLLDELVSTGIASRPQMVITGDFNNDKIIDFAVANSGTSNVGIYLGYQNKTFQSMNQYSTGSQSSPTALATGYLNADNRTDLVVANYEAHNIGVFIAFDTGSFQTLPPLLLYSLTWSTSNRFLAKGDFNNDGILDILFVDGNNNNVGIILGYPNGTFSNATLYFMGSGSFPVAAALADFNNDKNIDIAVVNRDANEVCVLLGFGNGTFNNQTASCLDSLSSPVSIAAGDLNNDRVMDIVVAYDNENSVVVALGVGNGSFTNLTTFSTGDSSWPISVALGDLNRDNFLDVVVANLFAESFYVLLSAGSGTFVSEMTFSTGSGSQPIDVKVGDFNNDNCLDVAVLALSIDTVEIFLGNGNGSFTNSVNFFIGHGDQLTAMSLADFNNDAFLDVAVACWYNNAIKIFFGDGTGGIIYNTRFSSAYFFQPQHIVVGDFNNDQRSDIIVIDTYRIHINFGSRNPDYLDMMPYSTGNNSFPSSVSIRDLNNDRLPDIVVANSGTDNIGLFFGTGRGLFGNQSTISTGRDSAPYAVFLADLNNDTQLDIAVANNKAGNVGIFVGYGNGSFSVQKVYPLEPLSDPYWLAIGDVNDDALPDIVVVCLYSNRLSVLFGMGFGLFENIRNIPLGYGSLPAFVALGNFNNDSFVDIVVANSGYGNMEIYAPNCYF